MPPSKSIAHTQPTFVIPAGTQVVLKSDIQIDAQRRQVKKSGTVGVVLRCPPNNGAAYLVRFNDESTAEIPSEQLAIRRQEIDVMLNQNDDFDFQPYIIYRCQVGSKAYGLAHEGSDDDIRGIFLPPAERTWSLHTVPGQIDFMRTDPTGIKQDEVYWELEKFIRLALKANPNILEVLYSPMVIQTSPIADRLREMRDCFLSKHIYKTYSGYVLSQFRRMKNSVKNQGTFKLKHAMHLVRLLYSGIAALNNRQIMVDVSPYRSELLQIRNGELYFEQIEQKALALEAEFQSAFEKSDLPEQPDFQAVDQFLIEARRSMAS